jgi:hypothetical protein
MSPTTVKDIERAIEALTLREVEELVVWLEQRYPQAIDTRIQSDLEAGRLDAAIGRALDDEEKGRTRPL